VFDDPERYEHDGFYEDSDYEDEYEVDDSDYIAVDEENALWDEKLNYPNRSDGRLQKKNSSSKNWKPTPRNIPLRMVLTRKNRSVRSSNENCGQKPLHDWRIPPEHNGSLKM